MVERSLTRPAPDGMTDEDVGELRRRFDSFDVDRNGEINYEEFVGLLESIGPRPSVEEAKLAFSIIDSDEGGVVTFTEFVRWWCDY